MVCSKTTALGFLVLLTGCDLVLGIEDWTDPARPPTGGGDPTTSSSTGGASSSSSGTGGTGGSPITATGTCADGTLDLGETDIDCGGDACGPCGPAQACLTDADCATLLCVDEACGAETPEPTCTEVDPQNPNCNDCVENSDETDVDCGGDACPPCEADDTCLIDADCVLGTICTIGTCTDGTAMPGCATVDPLMPSCIDCELNGDELGVDCGGDACPPCP